jgi:EmrB/QacA subfamily drug resistance transporter
MHVSIGITGYMLSLAVFIPISGWLADRFGARTVFRAAIGIFTLASVLCGLATGVVELTVARVLQGMGGAMMVPVGRLVLLRSVAKSEMVRAMAYLMVPALLGPIVGPPIGGFITTYASWRWIFFLNVPIGMLGMALVTVFIENHREPETPSFDWLGFGLTGAALIALMYGFELVGRDDASPVTISAILAAGLATGGLAVRHARRHSHPLVDLSLLRIPTFAMTIWGGSLFRLGVGAIPFLLPLMLQIGFGLTAFSSGLLTFAAGAGSLTMKASALPILRRFGFRSVLVWNGAVSCVSIMACGLLTPSTPTLAVLGVVLAGGFFRSLEFTGLNTLAFADISTRKMSAASSFSSMVQQVALGTGVALGASLLHLTLAYRGGDAAALTASNFQFAFGAIGVVSLAGLPFFMRLAPDAGSEVSGHRRLAAKNLEGEPVIGTGD